MAKHHHRALVTKLFRNTVQPLLGTAEGEVNHLAWKASQRQFPILANVHNQRLLRLPSEPALQLRSGDRAGLNLFHGAILRRWTRMKGIA